LESRFPIHWLAACVEDTASAGCHKRYCKRVVSESLLIRGYPERVDELSGPADFGLALKLNEEGVLPAARAKKIEGDSVWPRRPLFD